MTESVRADVGARTVIQQSGDQVSIVVHCYDEGAAKRFYTELINDATKHQTIQLA